MSIKSKSIVIVLVEPLGEINVGSIARLCKNFEVKELRLVSPRCNHLSQDSKKMAVKGINLLEAAKEFSSLKNAIADCDLVIATAGRIEHGDIPLNSSTKTMDWVFNKTTEKPVAFIFGREDRGLSNKELLLAHKVISIQTATDYPSLNLSHAVAIVLNEFSHTFNNHKQVIKPNQYVAAHPVDIADCLNDAKDLLLQIGYLMDHTVNARMTKIRKLLNRAEVRKGELALIRGMVSQVRWALKEKKDMK